MNLASNILGFSDFDKSRLLKRYIGDVLPKCCSISSRAAIAVSLFCILSLYITYNYQLRRRFTRIYTDLISSALICVNLCQQFIVPEPPIPDVYTF